jgi:hypothetical protein
MTKSNAIDDPGLASSGPKAEPAREAVIAKAPRTANIFSPVPVSSSPCDQSVTNGTKNLMRNMGVSLDVGPGQTLTFSPDRAIYKRTCKRANDADFQYECPNLWVAVELFLATPAK